MDVKTARWWFVQSHFVSIKQFVRLVVVDEMVKNSKDSKSELLK